MQITKNGIIVTIPDAEVIQMALKRLGGTITELAEVTVVPSTPRIGETWESESGIYAGVARGRDGAADYHLIVGPEMDGTADWDATVKWAGSALADGHKDFRLPFRKEQALCFANVPELFKPEYYWSGEQRVSYSSVAWGQGFGNGDQSVWGKGGKLRARAVRSLIIQ